MKKLLFILTGLVTLGWALPALAERVDVYNSDGSGRSYYVVRQYDGGVRITDRKTWKDVTIYRTREYGETDPPMGIADDPGVYFDDPPPLGE